MFNVGEISEAWARQSRLNTFYQGSVASTNDWAKEKAFTPEVAAAPISLYLADAQTQGRGRGHHSWSQALNGSALLSSWVYQLSLAPQPVVTCRIGLAVEKALSATWPWLHWSLKAPNDIYLASGKMGGILVENLQQGNSNCMIIGLGLNIFSHPEIPHATDLLAHLHGERFVTTADWNIFLDRLFLELSSAVSLSGNLLSLTEQSSLLLALNKKPDLTEKYTSVEADGTLITAQRRIHWTEL